jgi:hypothetical protein
VLGGIAQAQGETADIPEGGAIVQRSIRENATIALTTEHKVDGISFVGIFLYLTTGHRT